MSGHMEYRQADWDRDVFELATVHGRKIRCRVCAATGYPNHEYRFPGGAWQPYEPWWGFAHTRHPWECSDCERAFTSPQGLSAHRRSQHPVPLGNMSGA